MSRIARLSPTTIGKIAAGEVVERPAAVVKELIENAIDASASRIDVEIEDGGVERLQVRDDGHGIPLDQLEMSVERHTTSKLRDIEDLGSIRTLGFRGEALASVAAVSELTIQSIATDGTIGGRLRVAFGNVEAAEPSAWGVGTSVEVQRLFENVPARRRFLRTPRTESAYIERVVGAHGLAYPQIAFSLTVDGRRVVSTDGRSGPLGAAGGVWGHEDASQLVEIVAQEHEHEGYDVSGIVSLPSFSRARRDRLHIFVQGRLVQNRQIAAAVEQAYHTLLMIGRRPVGCIVVNVPADRIDVNVHPTKMEVRFVDERLVFALVRRAVTATLAQEIHHQSIPTVINAPLAPRAVSVPTSQDVGVQRMLRLADPMRSRSGERETVSVDDRPDAEPAGGKSLPVLRVLGQVAGAFITAEGPDGLYLIDQHAAHERILFEEIMEEYASREPAKQSLLEPIVIELTAEQSQMLESCHEELLALGFEFEEFGRGSFALRAIPNVIGRKNPATALQAVLDEMIDGGRGDSRLESLAISAACHGSIRAGQPMSLLEMRELVTSLERCQSSLACGHGRPTIIRMTADELARQFSRR
ncbi:DNA mismatch repair endonuclease MutL [soil metagenome]